MRGKNKQKIPNPNKEKGFRVSDRDRTDDPQNHNLML
jgi:hypothetical protein